MILLRDTKYTSADFVMWTGSPAYMVDNQGNTHGAAPDKEQFKTYRVKFDIPSGILNGHVISTASLTELLNINIVRKKKDSLAALNGQYITWPRMFLVHESEPVCQTDQCRCHWRLVAMNSIGTSKIMEQRVKALRMILRQSTKL